MTEYGLVKKNTEEMERNTIFGRNLADAFRRSGLNPEEWVVDYSEYID